MSIDEAIAEERDNAKTQREIAEECFEEHIFDEKERIERLRCANESEQVAEWLEELKSYRASVFSGDMTQKMLKEQYCKGVDDFATKICEILEEYQTGFNMVSMANVWHFSRELAKQLKAGGENERSI